jgi:hypothetical protein
VKARFQELAAQWHEIPGLAAWCVRFPDRTIATHCFSDWFNSKQLEQVLNRVALAAVNLTYHGFEPTRLCWKFERARLFLVARPDSSCLVLFLENRPDLTTDQAEAALVDFVNLQ